MRPTSGNARFRRGHRRVGWLLAGLLVVGGATRAAPAAGASHVVGHVGAVTVTATSFQPGRDDTLTSDLRVTTSSPGSDQLEVALAAGDTAVGVYHQQVSVGEIPGLASCDGDLPSQLTVNQWLHYGPLLVPGSSYGPAPPATAILTVPSAAVSVDGGLAVTMYFAHAGPLTLDLPVHRT
jgi:hypothetical protein